MGAAQAAAGGAKAELEKELAAERAALSAAHTRLAALKEVEEKAATLNLADVDRMRSDLAARTAEVREREKERESETSGRALRQLLAFQRTRHTRRRVSARPLTRGVRWLGHRWRR